MNDPKTVSPSFKDGILKAEWYGVLDRSKNT